MGRKAVTDAQMDAAIRVGAIVARGLDACMTRASAPGVSDMDRDKALVSALNQAARVAYLLDQIGEARPDLAARAEAQGRLLSLLGTPPPPEH